MNRRLATKSWTASVLWQFWGTRAVNRKRQGTGAPRRANARRRFRMHVERTLPLSMNANRWLVRAVCVGFSAVSLGCASSALASITTNVNVGDDFFSPTKVTLHANDNVKWTWIGARQHSSTGPGATPLWDSGTHGNGFTFTHTFTNAGSFPYRCVIHAQQTGTVTVLAVTNSPPTVALTSPTNGSTFAAPWTGVVQGKTSDLDGTVTKVDLFAGTALLGTVTSPSSNFTIGVTNLIAGSYVLRVVATDSGGATNTSAGISIQAVTPDSIVLGLPQRISRSEEA